MDPRTKVTVIAVLAAAVFLAAVTIAVDRGDDNGTATLPSPTTTTTAAGGSGSSTTTLAGGSTTTTAAGSAIDDVVAEISEFVERERGLEFVTPVAVELADRDEFERRLLADFDEAIDDLREAGVTLRALGLIDPDVDIVETYRELLGGGVVGFYDPETDELVVRGTDPTPYVREIIAHELTHALDDQHFNLHRPDLDEADDERGFGWTTLVEGDAVRIQDAYTETMTEDERAESLAEQLAALGDLDLGDIPDVLVQLLSVPYEIGPEFVESVLDQGGQQALDAAFNTPPTTSEQVLDPDLYVAGEGAVPVPEPSADGAVLDRGSIGVLVLRLVLDDIDRDVAEAALRGWGGDTYVSWRDDGGRACIRLAVVGDTATDTAELVEAFDDWASDHGDASTVTGEGQPVTVTACR